MRPLDWKAERLDKEKTPRNAKQHEAIKERPTHRGDGMNDFVAEMELKTSVY